MQNNIVKSGDRILLIDEKGKSFSLKIQEDKSFSTHNGVINFNDIIGIEYGSKVFTHKNVVMFVVKPGLVEKMMKVKRQTQIIYPKDAAAILMWLGVEAGDRVIEIGTGSGSLTIALANAVGDEGKVYTYDRREDFQNNAKNNIENAELIDRVEFKIINAGDDFAENEVDEIFIDLPSPWFAMGAALKSLKSGGRLGALSPTCNQIEEMAELMREKGFIEVISFELLQRFMLPRRGMTRPVDRMASHTGYLLFGTKIKD